MGEETYLRFARGDENRGCPAEEDRTPKPSLNAETGMGRY